MTLNGLNGYFTLNFHYYKLALTKYLLLIYCIGCLHLGIYTHEQQISAGSGVADRDPQNPRKNCGSFVDAHRQNLNK